MRFQWLFQLKRINKLANYKRRRRSLKQNDERVRRETFRHTNHGRRASSDFVAQRTSVRDRRGVILVMVSHRERRSSVNFLACSTGGLCSIRAQAWPQMAIPILQWLVATLAFRGPDISAIIIYFSSDVPGYSN